MEVQCVLCEVWYESLYIVYITCSPQSLTIQFVALYFSITMYGVSEKSHNASLQLLPCGRSRLILTYFRRRLLCYSEASPNVPLNSLFQNASRRISQVCPSPDSIPSRNAHPYIPGKHASAHPGTCGNATVTGYCHRRTGSRWKPHSVADTTGLWGEGDGVAAFTSWATLLQF